MTRVRPTGFSLPLGFGVQWEFAESDKDIARRAIIFLEDRRVLFGERHMEDELDCVRSAIEIRSRLTDLIAAAHPGGGVELCLREIRAACTQFVTQAGPGARNFHGYLGSHANPFGQALGEMRSLVGIQVARLVDKYGFEIEEDLLSIFPPPDEPPNSGERSQRGLTVRLQAHAHHLRAGLLPVVSFQLMFRLPQR